MKNFINLLFALTILTTSCKNEAEQQNDTTTTNVVPFTEVGRQMKNQSQTSNQQQPATIDPVTTNTVAPSTISTVAKGMNPAHGQPGHRCDIAVGAPLNAPAVTKPNQNAPAPATTITTAATPAEATPTPEGMNPPHGQTNHRCDIAVGAPLPK
ncbi:hypothetical protein H4V97_000187 [Flavobacterium sp. CG_23.5]|uniref:hypothetical protein n=1 Tax=Flavobacterium sp. CG_23.5 TaxID=2760708 RepID=UPI0018C921AE|nr:MULTISPECIES: hypothetical protein [unclassified Flavobacterium]MBG6110134.1 hypothetical protein [Flavobacterium sp. CG_9.10]MBP2281869.1 hypothetical protein [Flavobacterium sp. CG_23.5]